MPMIAMPMPASPQKISSMATGSVSPVGSPIALSRKSTPYRPICGGLLHDRPRELLALVPLVGGGTDDVLGEVVGPLLDLQLVFVEIEREVRHGRLSYPPVTTLSTHR